MKIFTKSAIAGVVVLSVAAAYLERDNFASYPAIPTHAMPNPNGFAYFAKAGTAILGDLGKAGADGDVAIGLHSGKLTLQQKEAVLQAVAPDLKLLHEGIGLPYESPPIRSWKQTTPYLSKYRPEWDAHHFPGS